MGAKQNNRIIGGRLRSTSESMDNPGSTIPAPSLDSSKVSSDLATPGSSPEEDTIKCIEID